MILDGGTAWDQFAKLWRVIQMVHDRQRKQQDAPVLIVRRRKLHMAIPIEMSLCQANAIIEQQCAEGGHDQLAFLPQKLISHRYVNQQAYSATA